MWGSEQYRGTWLKRNLNPLGPYRGTSLIRKRTPLGPYRRPMPRVLGALGGWTFSDGRGNPVQEEPFAAEDLLIARDPITMYGKSKLSEHLFESGRGACMRPDTLSKHAR